MAVTAPEWDPSLEILCDPLLSRVLGRNYRFQAAGSTELQERARVAPRMGKGQGGAGRGRGELTKASVLAPAPRGREVSAPSRKLNAAGLSQVIKATSWAHEAHAVCQPSPRRENPFSACPHLGQWAGHYLDQVSEKILVAHFLP